MKDPRDRSIGARQTACRAASGPWWATALLAVLVALPCGTLARAAGNEPMPHDVLVRRVQQLETRLQAIEGDAAWKSLFTSEQVDIVRMQAWFALAQKALHGASLACANGNDLASDAGDDFHGALHEYLINLQELAPSETLGTTKAPDAGAKKKLIAAIDDADRDANELPGLQDVSVQPLTAQSSAAEAVAYAHRQLNVAYRLLSNRTLTFVTSQGTGASHDLRAALDAAWQALDKLVDKDGNPLPQESKDGKPLADALAPFKAAMAEARTQAEYFRKMYLPTTRADAQRRRAQTIEAVLAEAGFERRVLAVKALSGGATRVASAQ